MLQLRKVKNGWLVEVYASAMGYGDGDQYVFTDWDNVISFIKDVKFEEASQG